MKVVFQFTALLLVALVIECAQAAEENCNAWQAAAVDPAAGQYLLELRSCDLTYGLSAFIQIKNSTDSRLMLSYRVTTNDDQYRDDDIILEPKSTMRAGNCQACAKRHVGLKSWEILSVKVSAAAPTTAHPVTDKPATVQEPGSPVSPAQKIDKPVEKTLVTERPVVDKTVVDKSTVVEKPPVADKPATPPVQDSEKKSEGKDFKTEGGKVIPYDQLPPEFRPRK